MEALVEIDKALFLWLNGLGSPSYDGFWMVMTHRASNVVLYFFLWLYFIYKTNWKLGVILLVFTGVLILCTDQLTNLVKATAGRLRPCYDEEIKVWVRLVKPTCGNRFGFFSGHASNSFALAVFYSLLLKPYLKKKVLLLFLIAALIAYSRVYIGVHFPLDIVIGALAGAALGYGFYLLWRRFIPFQELKK